MSALADLYPRSMEYKGGSVDQAPVANVKWKLWSAYPDEMSMEHKRGEVGFA